MVFGHQGSGIGGRGGVLMPLVVPLCLARREWRPLCFLDSCGQRSLAGPPSWGAAVRRWWWALGRVLVVVCPRGLEVGSCNAARPGPWMSCRTLLAGALAGPLPRLEIFGLVRVGGRWSPLSLRTCGCASDAPL